MSKRLEKLRRIAAVQQKIVRHSELQHALAEKKCQELAEDKARLQGYVREQGGLGPTLAKAALRSLHRLDTRLDLAREESQRTKDVLTHAKRREHVAGEIEDRVARVEARVVEDRDLARIVEAWLVGKDTSLP